MSGLKIRLQPKERVLINGVVVENGDRRACLNIVSTDARVLLLRDALHPDEARTPVKRLYYVCQLLVAGEGDAPSLQAALTAGLDDLATVFTDPTTAPVLETACRENAAGRHYPALKALKSLIKYEHLMLTLIPESAQTYRAAAPTASAGQAASQSAPQPEVVEP